MNKQANMRITRSKPSPAMMGLQGSQQIQQPMAASQSAMPMIPHQMVTAIRNSPKGKIPPGLAKYMAAHAKKKK